MRKKQRTKSKDTPAELAKRRPFIDGFDSYASDYERWKKMEVVKGLVGVYELSDEQFQKDTRDLLPAFGFSSHEQLFYNVEHDNAASQRDMAPSGTGWTSAIRDPYGRVKPIIFLRKSVVVDDPNDDNSEFEGATRLLVLMHELGHAKDIVNAENYDHDALSLDIVAAEVYAHRFVFRHAVRMGYRLVLRSYLDAVKEHLAEADEAARLAAERFFSELTDDEVRKATRDMTEHEVKHAVRVSGREKEFAAWASK